VRPSNVAYISVESKEYIAQYGIKCTVHMCNNTSFEMDKDAKEVARILGVGIV